MSRIARIVIPHVSHHVMQRGNRRLPTFLNPIVVSAADYPWSSARGHFSDILDTLLKTDKLLALRPNWSELLNHGLDKNDSEVLRRHESIGKPLGGQSLLPA